MPKTMIDDSGELVGHGDHIVFSFGIPPTRLTARIEQRGDRLFAVVLEHGYTPEECNLRSLRRYVGRWDKVDYAEIGRIKNG